jgi:hypothetical protein
MTGGGLPPNFRLNLTGIQKNATPAAPEQPEEPAGAPKQIRVNLKHNLQHGTTVQPKPKPVESKGRPGDVGAVSTTLSRKNLVIHSDSSEDSDLDLESIPIGAEEPPEKADMGLDVIEAPTIQVSQLPDLVDDDDDEGEVRGENKLSLLQDLLLSPELVDEPPDEWTYKTFIRMFQKSEADEDEHGEEESDYYDFSDDMDGGEEDYAD